MMVYWLAEWLFVREGGTQDMKMRQCTESTDQLVSHPEFGCGEAVAIANLDHLCFCLNDYNSLT